MTTTAPAPATSWAPHEVLALAASGHRPAQVLAWTRTYSCLAELLHREPGVTLAGPAASAARLIPADGFVLTLDDPRYPAALRTAPSPPAVLYGLGDPDLLTSPGVAVNGTRQPSKLGTVVAEAAASAAGHAHAAVITGGADGCDLTATEAALQFEAPVVTVTATGPDQHPLTGRVRAGRGVLVSEHPFGTGTDSAPGYTPAAYTARLMARNRIIVGLAALLVPASGTFRSGTAAAVWTALAVGRPVVVARPRPAARQLPDAELPLALAHPTPPTAAQLQAAGCPAKIAAAIAGRGPLAHAVAGDTDELAVIIGAYVGLCPDRPATPAATRAPVPA